MLPPACKPDASAAAARFLAERIITRELRAEDSAKQRAGEFFPSSLLVPLAGGKSNWKGFPLGEDIIEATGAGGDGNGEWDEKFDRFSPVLQRFRDWKLLCIPRRNADSQVEWVLSGP